MKYIKNFNQINEGLHIKGFIENLKYRLKNPSKMPSFIDENDDMIYVEIPWDEIKTMEDGEKIISMANQYKQVKRAYIDGDTKSIKIQVYNAE
jgi:hypothetical protein